MNLKDKIAVVAGASGGIGRNVSLELAGHGAEVVLIGRRKPVLSALKRSIEQQGGKAHVFTADLTKPKSVDELVKKLKKRLGHVDILFNAAGVGVYKKFKEVSVEEWQRSLDVNVTAVFLLIQKLLPMLTKSKKAVVLSMGSGMGKIAVAGRTAYCASKFALRGLMRSLAKEYEKSNINFYLLTVGSVLTAFGPLTLEDKMEKQKKGKKYLDPSWLAHYIVAKIRNDTLEDETPIYPSHYFEESKKGKT